MEIIKNLNDSEEMIFLQAIDQNYLNYKNQNNEGISQQFIHEENSYSDLEDFFPNLNFNFIEFNDDSRHDSPSPKESRNNENFSNSIFSNDSTEAENNIYHLNNNNSNNSQFKSFNINNNNSNSNQSSCSSRKHSNFNINCGDNGQKYFSYDSNNNNLLKEQKINSEKIKNFLNKDFLDEQKLDGEIGKYKDRLRKEISEKLISHMKYLEYLKYYNTANRFIQNQTTPSMTTPNNVSFNFNLNFNNNFNQNKSYNNVNLKNHLNQPKASLDLNSSSFISNNAHYYLNNSYNLTKINSGNLTNENKMLKNEKTNNEMNIFTCIDLNHEIKHNNIHEDLIKQDSFLSKKKEEIEDDGKSLMLKEVIEEKSLNEKKPVLSKLKILLKEGKKSIKKSNNCVH